MISGEGKDFIEEFPRKKVMQRLLGVEADQQAGLFYQRRPLPSVVAPAR
jgi:hypothetical protein